MSDSAEQKELGQISVYLTKAGVDFDKSIDWESGFKKKKGFVDHRFQIDDASCRFVYYETSTPRSNPPWLDFANDQLPAEERIVFTSTSRSANGLLGLTVDNRLFLAAFGRSAAANLLRKTLETDFGIKTAMNLCGNEEIRA